MEKSMQPLTPRDVFNCIVMRRGAPVPEPNWDELTGVHLWIDTTKNKLSVQYRYKFMDQWTIHRLRKVDLANTYLKLCYVFGIEAKIPMLDASTGVRSLTWYLPGGLCEYFLTPEGWPSWWIRCG